MTRLTVTVNTNTTKGKRFIEFIKTLDYIKVEESPYNPEFVKKIKESRASKGKAIKTKDLWK